MLKTIQESRGKQTMRTRQVHLPTLAHAIPVVALCLAVAVDQVHQRLASTSAGIPLDQVDRSGDSSAHLNNKCDAAGNTGMSLVETFPCFLEGIQLDCHNLCHARSMRTHPTRAVPTCCLDPNTPPDQLDFLLRTVRWPEGDVLPAPFQLNDGYRWSETATNGAGLVQGDPTTVTWSIAPDGTPMDAWYTDVGELPAPSNLIAFLDAIYGYAPPPITNKRWFPVLQRIFDRWEALTGVDYVYEPNDDGSPFRSGEFAPGVLGVRGDVRIAGHRINGNSGILAYNFYPNVGEMVLDTADDFYTYTAGDSIRLINVLGHELGHGLGISHVCPADSTKLMEPYINTGFFGPQHDDILAGQRGYGDRYEHNDSSNTATQLDVIGEGTTTLGLVSIDDNSDVDWYAMALPAGQRISVTVNPVGFTYLSGPQDSGCWSGNSFNSLNQNDLRLEVLAPDGLTVLASATANPAGQSESIHDLDLTNGTSDYFVRIRGGDANTVQLYELLVTVGSSPCTAPLVIDHPQDQLVLPGESATFVVVASGSPPLRYQWRRNNAPIDGATADHYSIPEVSVAHAGVYDVVISNACGTIESNDADLVVGGCAPETARLTDGDAASQIAAVSWDGRYVVFESFASDLFPAIDSNGRVDVFLLDRQTGQLELISVTPVGRSGNHDSWGPAISADGRFVAFPSSASDLAPGDTNSKDDIYLRDRQTGTTRRISLSNSGGQGNHHSRKPSISSDGCVIAFETIASNLVPGDTNAVQDILVYDCASQTTTRVSVGASGAQANGASYSPKLSADGRYVAFASAANNLIGSSDSNGRLDIFVYDRLTGQTELVSRPSTGGLTNHESWDPAISADARFVAFPSSASNLVPNDTNGHDDVFVRDRLNGTTRRISLGQAGQQGNDHSQSQRGPAISSDGTVVAFQSRASNLVPGDTNGRQDVFMYNLQTGQLRRVSISTAGMEGNEDSSTPVLASDERMVVFQSAASNLDAAVLDTRGVVDIFVHALRPAGTGDVNGDGQSNGLDVSDFLAVFLDPGHEPGLALCAADLDADGNLDSVDVDLLVNLLLGY